MRSFFNYIKNIVTDSSHSDLSNYQGLLNQARENTIKLGLESPDLFRHRSSKLQKHLRTDIERHIWQEIYQHSDLTANDIASRCHYYTKELHTYLKTYFDIESIITSGSVTFNHEFCFKESLSSIERRLRIHNLVTMPEFHTWLTLETGEILDIGLIPSLFYKKLLDTQRYHAMSTAAILWTDPDTKTDHDPIYEPVFLGYEYFDKVKLPPAIIYCDRTYPTFKHHIRGK